MRGSGEEHSRLPKPINHQEAFSAEEVQTDIRSRVETLSGEELIKSLADYFMLALVQVQFEQDQGPCPLPRLEAERLESVRKAAELIISDPKALAAKAERSRGAL